MRWRIGNVLRSGYNEWIERNRLLRSRLKKKSSINMAQELIISISGMRGLVGENMFPETALAYGAAFGTFLQEQKPGGQERPVVAIGRDSRPSGAMFAEIGRASCRERVSECV